MTQMKSALGGIPLERAMITDFRTLAPNDSLARAVVGGLTVSTILTLFLVPTVYAMLEERFPRSTEQLAATDSETPTTQPA